MLLSRAQRLEDILIWRLPDKDALSAGPPEELLAEMEKLRGKEMDTIIAFTKRLQQEGLCDIQKVVTQPLLRVPTKKRRKA